MAHLAVGALCFFVGLMILRSMAPSSPEVLLPGTALTVRLVRPLTSQSARLGDAFEARVDSAQGINGAFPVPPKARVEGRCVAVRAAEGDERPGYLRLVLSGLWDSQGHFSPLETTTISLSGKWTAKPGQSAREIAAASNALAQAKDAAQSASDSNEVVVTPEESLTFVLLRPAVVLSRHWSP